MSEEQQQPAPRKIPGMHDSWDEAKIIEDFHKRMRNENLPECPNCKSRDNVIPSILGMPTRELAIYAHAGHAELLGCCPIPGKPMKRGKCKKCGTDIYAQQNM